MDNNLPQEAKKRVSKRLTLIVKRAFDLTVASILLFFLSPFLFVISLLIKRDSSGPILFPQTRVGENGRLFTMYKFRTMHVDCNPYDCTPADCVDPRITNIGKKLRKRGLDELAQLLNIFKGDMSIVGPRPEMPFIVEEYDSFHKKRLMAKPGVTCLWQLSPHITEPIHKHVEYDLYYIEHQSLWLDFKIILRTIRAIKKGFWV